MNNRHGAQNAHDEASKATLENEFGSHNEDDCIIKILEGGTMQETEVNEDSGVVELKRTRRLIWACVSA